jgi:nitrogen fixation protein FixH
MRTEERVNLENLGHGAASEMFQKELENVIFNIVDPNTKPEAVRSVTLKLKVKPSKERTMCSVELTCESKLAPSLPHETTMFVGVEHGEAVASEYDPNQMRIPFPEPIPEKPTLQLTANSK